MKFLKKLICPVLCGCFAFYVSRESTNLKEVTTKIENIQHFCVKEYIVGYEIHIYLKDPTTKEVSETSIGSPVTFFKLRKFEDMPADQPEFIITKENQWVLRTVELHTH